MQGQQERWRTPAGRGASSSQWQARPHVLLPACRLIKPVPLPPLVTMHHACLPDDSDQLGSAQLTGVGTHRHVSFETTAGPAAVAFALAERRRGVRMVVQVARARCSKTRGIFGWRIRYRARRGTSPLCCAVRRARHANCGPGSMAVQKTSAVIYGSEEITFSKASG